MIEQTRFGTRTTIRRTFKEVVESTKRALIAESFDIVSEVSLEPRLAERGSMPKCTMLGAWNSLASPVIDREPDIGAMLPCQIVIYEQAADTCVVSILDPCSALEVVGPDVLMEMAALDAREKLQRAIENV